MGLDLVFFFVVAYAAGDSLESFCLTSTETRLFIRDGDTGEGGGDKRVMAR